MSTLKLDIMDYFFKNGKTGFSVDFGLCPLMKIVDKVVKSPVCKGCYAATGMNVRSSLRKKILGLPEQSKETLEAFKADLPIIKFMLEREGTNRLRFYSWTDFKGPKDIEYIQAVLDIGLEAHIISKTLTQPHNFKHLKKLVNKKGVFISLSFNEDWMKFFPQVKDFIVSNKAHNIQLNYTINPLTDELTDFIRDTFQVKHLRNTNKRDAMEAVGLDEKETCAVFGKDGSRVRKGGACHACKNCDLGFLAHQKGKKGKLPDSLAA